VALAHAALVVCLPRVYLGFHFPSDVLAGAAIGVAVAALLLARPSGPSRARASCASRRRGRGCSTL
jgi:membrane-associated phospholipid phosphatase